jgi:chromosome segregation ATPase
VGVREQADAERVRLEGVLDEERSKSEYLFGEVGVLREQVAVKDAEVAAREAELVGVREQADAERVRLEGVLDEERSKSEYLFAEAGVLREQVAVKEAELVGVREQQRHLESSVAHLDRQLLFAEAELREQVAVKDAEVAAREAELVGVREQADAERVRLEGVLDEERSKSEYLFAEAGVLREQVAVKEAELQKALRQLSAMDHELSSLAISSLKNQHAANRLTTTLLENQVLSDSLAWAARDIKRLTSSRMFRLRRRIRLAIAMAISFKRDGIGVKADIIPISLEPQEYVDVIRESGLTEKELLELRGDLLELEINPYSHFVARGRSEIHCSTSSRATS